MATKHLQQFYDKHADEIKEAVRLDGVGLLDPRDEVRAEFYPKEVSEDSPLESFIIRNKTPYLPFPLELMNTEELILWVFPEIRRDLLKTKGLVTERIKWGEPKYEPSR